MTAFRVTILNSVQYNCYAALYEKKKILHHTGSDALYISGLFWKKQEKKYRNSKSFNLKEDVTAEV